MVTKKVILTKKKEAAATGNRPFLTLKNLYISKITK